MFYEQLKNLCAENNIKLTPTLKKLGLSSANTGKWKNGGLPSLEVLLKLARFFDVSTDYLLGIEPEQKKAPPPMKH